MEHIIQSCQEITRNFFQSIDDQSLTNARIVSRSWKDFIDREKFSWIRINQKYINKDHTPLHIAAEKGHWYACQLLIANSEDKNPKGAKHFLKGSGAANGQILKSKKGFFRNCLKTYIVF